MKIKLTKNLILLITMVMLCFSCTKEERREVIKSEVDRSTSFENDRVNDNNTETNYKYIINTRTGKVHTYSDGISRVSEKYQHKTNDSIEKILENEN